MATILAVSPHLDDAVLSYGGSMAEHAKRGDDVLVFTVFAGSPEPPYSPVAEYFHQLWKVQGDPVAPRRDEDGRAMAVLGVKAVHGRFLDSIYRRDGESDWLIKPGTLPHGGAVSDEPTLVAEVSAVIEQLILDFSPSHVVTCSAVGDHVDHRRTRDATTCAAGRTGTRLRLWEDLPYATWTSDIPPMPAGSEPAGSAFELVGKTSWEAKSRAIDCYCSQLPMFENGNVSIHEQLEAFAQKRMGERQDRAYSERVWEVKQKT